MLLKRSLMYLLKICTFLFAKFKFIGVLTLDVYRGIKKQSLKHINSKILRIYCKTRVSFAKEELS